MNTSIILMYLNRFSKVIGVNLVLYMEVIYEILRFEAYVKKSTVESAKFYSRA